MRFCRTTLWIKKSRSDFNNMTLMYGPAVRCKRVSSSWRWTVLHQCIRPLIWSSMGSWPSWRTARLRSHYRTGLSGPFGSPVFASAGKTDTPSRLVLSQTSAGRDAGYGNACPSSRVEPSGRLRSRLVDAPRLEGAAMGENAPCDARQFVGERDCQHIVVQSSFGSIDPSFEPVVLPALRSDQNDPGGLNE